MYSGIGSSTLVLLAVPLQAGGYATNITVKGVNWGDYFIYSDTLNSWVVMSDKIILGTHTDLDNTTTMGIGHFAGYLQQSPTAVAIGTYAGNRDQITSAIAIGHYAGEVLQEGIAIGTFAGNTNQKSNGIAIGQNAGKISQKSIAVGYNAGLSNQQTGAIAIGHNAGYLNQSAKSIAIGYNAGYTNQMPNSIAIGSNTSAKTKGIVINAFDTPLNPATTGVFIRPILGPMSATNLLSWDTATNEIFYNGSSQRFKYDIRPLIESKRVCELQPKEFKYKSDDSPDIGLIAEDAFRINNAFAYLDKDGIPEGIQWNAITVSLLREIQQIKRRIDILKKKKRK